MERQDAPLHPTFNICSGNFTLSLVDYKKTEKLFTEKLMNTMNIIDYTLAQQLKHIYVYKRRFICGISTEGCTHHTSCSQVQYFELCGKRLTYDVIKSFCRRLLKGTIDIHPTNSFELPRDRIEFDITSIHVTTIDSFTILNILWSHTHLLHLEGEEYTERFIEVCNTLVGDIRMAAIVIKEKTAGDCDGMINLVLKQYIKILVMMEKELTCVRYKMCNNAQQKQIRQRLLDGLYAVILHFVYSHAVLTTAMLEKIFLSDTIILHGSYFFGDNSINPNDMDLIISSSLCNCSKQKKKPPLPHGLRQTVANNGLNIGSRFNELDMLIGIMVCDTIPVVSSAETQYRQIATSLGRYQNKMLEETDAEHQYRYITNIAILIRYFLEQLCSELKQKIRNKSQNFNALTEKMEQSSKTLLRLIENANTRLVRGKEKSRYTMEANKIFRRAYIDAFKR